MGREAILALRKFRIFGFKALHGATFHMRDRTLLLIGGNGSGKSSTLQAMALVREFAQGDAGRFFDARNWERGEVRSYVPGLRSSTFRADLLFDAEDDGRYLWQFEFSLANGRSRREFVWHFPEGSDEPSLRLSHHHTTATTLYLPERQTIRGFSAPGSVLAFYEFDQDDDASGLLGILSWARKVTSLELLSPTAMRQGARGETHNIGGRGERLASFLANLDAQTRSKVVERLARFYPIANIETTRKRAGWVDMRIAERFGSSSKMVPTQASDGLLRLMALCTVPEFSDATTMVLLDEIEDGIEPHILPDVVQAVVAESQGQFVFTSHSPLLVNFFPADAIHVLAKRRRGSVAVCSFGELGDFGGGEDYFGPGELWSIAAQNDLESAVVRQCGNGERERRDARRFSQVAARRFATE